MRIHVNGSEHRNMCPNGCGVIAWQGRVFRVDRVPVALAIPVRVPVLLKTMEPRAHRR